MRPTGLRPPRCTLPPSGEYLTALSTRLIRTRPTLSGSPRPSGSSSVGGRARARAPGRGAPAAPRRRRCDERERIAVLDRDVQRVGVEPARPEDVVDGAREPVGLARDDVEQLRALLVVERDVAAAQRHRRAVDRGERRAQLVRDGRDELGAHRLERALLGQVAERVDDAVGDGDAVDREPQLAAAEVERQRLGPRARPSPRR